jgi:hypothetical protein
MRLPRTTIAVVGALACLIAGASVALGAGSSKTPASGPIQIIVQPGLGQGDGKILITGAVGDYGSSSPTVSSAGKKFATATLKKGTIKLDLTAVTAKLDGANPAIVKATCSGFVTETAATPVVSGTGLYAGIHGTVQLTETFGFLGSPYESGPKKGQCNMTDSAPTLAQMGTVYGSGAVSF